MNCRHCESLIQTSLDADLTPSERMTLDAHAAVCPSCHNIWDEHRQLSRLADAWTRAAEKHDGDEAFVQAVLARLPAPRPAFSPLGWPAWAVASLAVLLTASVLLLWPGVAAAPSVSALLPAPSDALTLPGWLARTFGGLASFSLPAAPSLPLSSLWITAILVAAVGVNLVCFGWAGRRTAR